MVHPNRAVAPNLYSLPNLKLITIILPPPAAHTPSLLI
jgi:hypothetical protein